MGLCGRRAQAGFDSSSDIGNNMSYYDDEYEYEPDDDEMEESGAMSNTEAVFEGEVLKIEFDTRNLALGIVGEVKQQLKDNLYAQITKEIKEELLNEMKDMIRENASEIVHGFIDEFLMNERITVGGGYYDDEKRKEYTLLEYSKKCIGDCIKNSKFRIESGKDRYGDRQYKELPFSEYIKARLGIDDETKTFIDSQIADIKNQINSEVKCIFDESTKTMLSDTVLKILMANDTYKKIEGSISCIADRKE